MKTICLNPKLPVILMDTSYFIFYRYFSTLKWFQFREKNIDYTTIVDNTPFIEAFKKHVYQDFKKLCKQWKTQLSNIILCYDCSRDRIWRNDHHDNYKGHRLQSVMFHPGIFLKFYETIEANPEWGIHTLEYDRLEADDIVYLVKQKLNTHYTIIVTNDNDYLQMIDSNTLIHNMTGKGLNLIKRSCGDPQKDLKIKMIMGDKSDNIEPIHSGIGPKTAVKLVDLSNEDFETYLDKHECRAIYEKNKKLIDFTEIPKEYSEGFQQTYQLTFIES